MVVLNRLKNRILLLLAYRFKKVKAATLVESLVASVIIVVVFAIASLTLNNVFRSTVKGNTASVQNRMNTIAYLAVNNKITVPYSEDFENWTIHLKTIDKYNTDVLVLEAIQPNTKKKIYKQIAFGVEN